MPPLAKRLVLVLVVAGAIFGGRLALGTPAGGACTDAFLCNALPARCLVDAADADGYCSRPCADASACEAGWTWAPVERRETSSGRVELESVCLRPGDAPASRHSLRRR